MKETLRRSEGAEMTREEAIKKLENSKREFNFRYVMWNKETGKTVKRIFTLDEIEEGFEENFIEGYEIIGFCLIAREVFTGLRDKNGKMIFEGDILRAFDSNDPLTFSVMWYDYGGTNLLGINTKAFKVIGNIHDNPKLLGETNG